MANALVCKTSIPGFNSRSVLQISASKIKGRAPLTGARPVAHLAKRTLYSAISGRGRRTRELSDAQRETLRAASVIMRELADSAES